MTPEQWQHIREVYKQRLPAIMDASKNGRRLDPNFVDWVPLFSPIEYDAWICIRGLGVPLYPALVQIGWKVFRIPGRQATKTVKRPEEFEFMKRATLEYMETTARWLQSADGVITAINEVYFKGNVNSFDGRYITTLDMHQLADFELLPHTPGEGCV